MGETPQRGLRGDGLREMNEIRSKTRSKIRSKIGRTIERKIGSKIPEFMKDL